MTKVIDRKTPIDRINYSGSLDPVVKRLSRAYEIGKAQEFSVINIGYEDCNIIVKTKHGKFLAKIFQKGRTKVDISRYTAIMKKAIKAGVNHPPLLQNQERNVIYSDSKANGLSLVVMRFIEGKTFFELNRPPNTKELKLVLEQAVKVNNMVYHPPYIFDSWAIPNIKVMFKKTKQFIRPKDLPLIEQVIARYNTIPVNALPHCFTHSDLTKTNVLKSENGDIYILDFSLANWYPRIQELAVIVANLMHDDTNKSTLKDKTELIAKEYGEFNKLTQEESKWFYDYTLVGVAMEILGALQEKYININDTEETEYLLNLGRKVLRKELTR